MRPQNISHWPTRGWYLGIAVAALLAGHIGCGGEQQTASTEEIERAQAIVKVFKKELMTALKEGLREGPDYAIGACRTKAHEISSDLSGRGITVGRTSHRLRNPKNAPEPWVEPLLAFYLENDDGSAYRTVRLADNSVGYVEPIYTQALCIACHGENIRESIVKRLDRFYPEDKARGFKAGELRGLFWIRLESQSTEK
ncbi:MAG: DUF3365 domain-containing protein [Candidatus Latescibacterota bacterium]|nr:MAG: DUF3365 domain-containing protein [Candidatus Latescibacterota bacterium]